MKKQDTNVHYRQGDVLLERVEEVPSSAKKQQVKGRIILAHGEATGHHHSLALAEPDSADWWKADDAGDIQYVDLRADAKLVHQEHAAVELPAGRYRVTRQREYSPEAIRRVAD